MAAPASGAPTPDDGVPIDADLIKVLASDTRRDILRLLGERRRTLTELAEALNLKKATVLEHLQKLTASELIRRMDDNERLWVYYELAPRGKRILNPGRTTRFYLILAGSALAVVVLGAIVAASILGGVGNPASSDADGAGAPQSALADEVSIRAPVVVWRGLDGSVSLPLTSAPPDALLMIDDPAGTISLPVADGRATLGAADVDRLSPGRHAMRLQTAAGELALPQALDVRDPALAIAPLVVTEDAESTLILSAGIPGLPVPTDLVVRVNGTPVPLSEIGRERSFTIDPSAPGSLRIDIGRLVSTEVLVVPDLRAEAAYDNGTLVLNLSDAHGPLPNASAELDGRTLGVADANGTILAAWPAPGSHALRLVAEDGRTREIPLSASEDSLAEIAPQLSLSAFSGRTTTPLTMHVDVENAGPTPQTVTLLARLEGQTIASALVEVTPGAVRQAELSASVGDVRTPIAIDAFSARASVMVTARFASQNASAGATANDASNTPPAAATTAPTTTTPVASTPMTPTPTAGPARIEAVTTGGLDLYYGRAPDATTLLYPPTMTTSPTAAAGEFAEPAVPFASPALVIALLAAVAVLAARRRVR